MGKRDLSETEGVNAYYEMNAKHESGLFYFLDDFAIVVDHDPSTFYRPDTVLRPYF